MSWWIRRWPLRPTGDVRPRDVQPRTRYLAGLYAQPQVVHPLRVVLASGKRGRYTVRQPQHRCGDQLLPPRQPEELHVVVRVQVDETRKYVVIRAERDPRGTGGIDAFTDRAYREQPTADCNDARVRAHLAALRIEPVAAGHHQRTLLRRRESGEGTQE